MKNSLFLHYGPGGNSDIEKIYFQDLEKIDFWNQPESKTMAALVHATQQKLKELFENTKTPHIIAHSFGSDLLFASISPEQAKKTQLTLISPLPNFFVGFSHLAEKLASLHSSDRSQKEAILQSLTALRKNPSRETFWPLVGAVTPSPHFENLYWKSLSAFEAYQNIKKQTSPLRISEWMNLLNETFQFNPLKPCLDFQKIDIYLGQSDPYLIGDEDSWWQECFPAAKTHFIDAGHYPHFEKPELFRNVLNLI